MKYSKDLRDDLKLSDEIDALSDTKLGLHIIPGRMRKNRKSC